MNRHFNTELITDKFYFSVWIYFILAGIIVGVGSYMEAIDETLQIIGYIASGVMVLAGFVLSKNIIRIRVSDDELIIEKYLFGKLTTKFYKLQHIEDLKYQQHVKSSVYFSNGSVKVMGMDLTPESMKKYYYHKEIISFMYEGRSIELGKWKKAYDGQQLYSLLNKK